MAWLANPFAYVAINTVGAVIPQLAQKFQLSPTQSGVFCSLWFFVRTFAFIGLWRWTGWHYRFRWLLAAFIGLVVSFAAMMLATQLWLVLVAQLIFGCAVGLIYYSSLFYSMDVGEAKGEHGGLHEAAIGLGICIGPAVGAAALSLPAQAANAGSWAVSGLLSVGLGGLIWLRTRK
jgi:predicted MFS family arabinose efflux permease